MLTYRYNGVDPEPKPPPPPPPPPPVGEGLFVKKGVSDAVVADAVVVDGVLRKLDMAAVKRREGLEHEYERRVTKKRGRARPALDEPVFSKSLLRNESGGKRRV